MMLYLACCPAVSAKKEAFSCVPMVVWSAKLILSDSRDGHARPMQTQKVVLVSILHIPAPRIEELMPFIMMIGAWATLML